MAVKSMDARLIMHLCFGVVAVELNVTASKGKRKLAMCSAYFPHDDGPPKPMIKPVEHCQEIRLPLIVRCDANSHHTVWRSTDTNDKSKKL